MLLLVAQYTSEQTAQQNGTAATRPKANPDLQGARGYGGVSNPRMRV